MCPAEIGVSSSAPRQHAKKKVDHKLTLQDFKAILDGEADPLNKLQKATAYVLANNNAESFELFDQTIQIVFDKIIEENKELSTIPEKFKEIVSQAKEEAALLLEKMIDYHYNYELALQQSMIDDFRIWKTETIDFEMMHLRHLINLHTGKKKNIHTNAELKSLRKEMEKKIYRELRALNKEGYFTRDVLYHVFVEGGLKLRLMMGGSSGFSTAENIVDLSIFSIFHKPSCSIKHLLREEVLGHANKFFLKRSLKEKKSVSTHHVTRKEITENEYNKLEEDEKKNYISPVNAFYPFTPAQENKYRKLMEEDMRFLEKIGRELVDSSIKFTEEELNKRGSILDVLSEYYRPAYIFKRVHSDDIEEYKRSLEKGGKGKWIYESDIANSIEEINITVKEIITLTEDAEHKEEYSMYFTVGYPARNKKEIFKNFLLELRWHIEQTKSHYPDVPSISKSSKKSGFFQAASTDGLITQAVSKFRHGHLTEAASRLSSYSEALRDVCFPNIAQYDKQEFNKALNTKPYKHFLDEANANFIKTPSCTIL